MMPGFGACFDDDGNFDFHSYLLYRSKRMREEEDDEADVNDEDDRPKKRQFKSRNYAGYDPNDALNSEWYRRYVSEAQNPQNKKHLSKVQDALHQLCEFS